MRLIVGSRGSRLALIQAEEVIAQLRKGQPDLELELLKIKTHGDRERTAPLIQMGGQGVFVKELEEALLRGDVDVAVHSLKDMPSELEPRLRLAAVPPRQDPRDALVSRSGERLVQLPTGARIGTGSQRRALQLKAVRPDLEICQVRGNVDTRVRKVQSGELDGVILAAAALERMGMDDKVAEYLPVEVFLPAAGQGALGIEVKAGNGTAEAVVSAVNDEVSQQAVTAERAFLRTLGVGCRAAIAALAQVEGDTLQVEGMVGGPSGKILRTSVAGSRLAAEELGQLLAKRLLELGGAKLIEEAESYLTW